MPYAGRLNRPCCCACCLADSRRRGGCDGPRHWPARRHGSGRVRMHARALVSTKRQTAVHVQRNDTSYKSSAGKHPMDSIHTHAGAQRAAPGASAAQLVPRARGPAPRPTPTLPALRKHPIARLMQQARHHSSSTQLTHIPRSSPDRRGVECPSARSYAGRPCPARALACCALTPWTACRVRLAVSNARRRACKPRTELRAAPLPQAFRSSASPAAARSADHERRACSCTRRRRTAAPASSGTRATPPHTGAAARAPHAAALPPPATGVPPRQGGSRPLPPESVPALPRCGGSAARTLPPAGLTGRARSCALCAPQAPCGSARRRGTPCAAGPGRGRVPRAAPGPAPPAPPPRGARPPRRRPSARAAPGVRARGRPAG